jgi:phage FluMu protein Com
VLVTCPECHKKMKVAESFAGKKVRCPGCKKIVAAPDPQTVPSQRQAGRAEPAPSRRPSRDADPTPPTSTIRCAKCQAADVQALPPNYFSRRPGYVCSDCGTIMRQPGSTGICVFAILLGAFTFLLGLGLGVVAMGAEEFTGQVLAGAVSLAGLGVIVTAWGIRQVLRPVPLDPPPQSSRLWIWIVGILIGLLIVGLLAGGLFAALYFIHEM